MPLGRTNRTRKSLSVAGSLLFRNSFAVGCLALTAESLSLPSAKVRAGIAVPAKGVRGFVIRRVDGNAVIRRDGQPQGVIDDAGQAPALRQREEVGVGVVPFVCSQRFPVRQTVGRAGLL